MNERSVGVAFEKQEENLSICSPDKVSHRSCTEWDTSLRFHANTVSKRPEVDLVGRRAGKKTRMRSSIEYRGYVVEHDGAGYVASSLDGESCTLRSKSLIRVMRSVDALWTALDGGVRQAWIDTWLANPAAPVQLDAAAEAMLVPTRSLTPVFPVAPIVTPATQVAA